MQKITTFLWFDSQAEEAAQFYTSVFNNSRIISRQYVTEAGPGEQGSLQGIIFELEGQEFFALNGGPLFQFTPAISLFVNCESQAEVDDLWEKLSEGGSKDQCGWLRDRYGLSWQIVPVVLNKLISDPDPVKAARVTSAMLKMGKLDIAALQYAYDHAE